ncbi:MFS transporter [Fangia hongkongensis]|uniref:MFS transporter n=1 Tax=Fangia hongkongensis TaxID=270495 RepID=UPI000381BFFC|nr:MFS transporter [Fangia hongkongensis]MBK2126050.1 MFS transporter [Fangia hongkongensis]
MQLHKYKHHGWIIWFIVAFFYFYEYILRSAPSIMIKQLEQYLHVNNLAIAAIIGAFYYSYAPLQLVAGSLMDKFGGKKILPFAVLLCAIGCFLFIVQDSTVMLIGRLLIGAGSAFAFVGIIYVATNWIDKSHHGLVFGLTQAMGMIGGIAGQAILVRTTTESNWPNDWIALAIIGVILTVILLFIIPKRPAALTKAAHKKGRLFKNYLPFIKNYRCWFISLSGGFIFIPTTVFAMLWGVPYLEKAYLLSSQDAATLCSLVLFGWVFGSPLAGIISDKMQSFKATILISYIGVLVVFSLIIYTPLFSNLIILGIAMFLLGLFSGAQILVFAVTKNHTPEHAKGTSIGACNFLVFITTAILIPLSGIIMRLLNDQEIQYFSAHDFEASFIYIIICIIIAIILAFFALLATSKAE